MVIWSLAARLVRYWHTVVTADSATAGTHVSISGAGECRKTREPALRL